MTKGAQTRGIGGSDAASELEALSEWPDRAAPIARSEFEHRLEKARALTAAEGADALIISAGASLQYFANIAWGASERFVGLILPVTGKPVVICPAFEVGTLTASLIIDAGIRSWEEHESPWALCKSALTEFNATSTAIDPELPFWMVEELRAALPNVAISNATAVVADCRMLKSPAELALLKQAKQMTLEVHRRTARILRIGISASEVRQFIDDAHRKIGAAGSTFCIVLFGEATSFPHGVPGEQLLAEGDVVLIDTGCAVAGYNSDITRTYVFGEPTDEQRRIWDLEKQAQAAAFAAVRPGAACEAVDRAARDVLENAGLGPDYQLPGLPHRTGHGIGLSIHEAPYLVRGDKTPLAPGMCFSNEPMIVVPGKFGVRLEDHFYVTETGAKWFTEPSPSIDAPFG